MVTHAIWGDLGVYWQKGLGWGGRKAWHQNREAATQGNGGEVDRRTMMPDDGNINNESPLSKVVRVQIWGLCGTTIVGGIRGGNLTINKGGRWQQKIGGGRKREDDDGRAPRSSRGGMARKWSRTRSAAGSGTALPLPTTTRTETAAQTTLTATLTTSFVKPNNHLIKYYLIITIVWQRNDKLN